MGFRERLIDRMNEDEGLRRRVWFRAGKDVCYFINALGVTYQAKPDPLVTPMLLFPVQTRYMKLLQKDGGKRHFHVDKSRDMGITWCSLFFLFWCWLFIPRGKFHLASWKGELVDQKRHMGTHYGKLDHMIEFLPESVRPKIRQNHERRKMFLLNPDMQSVITGEATGARMGHQDRNLIALLDEFALMGERPQDGFSIIGGIRPTTDCMIIQSTPKGMGNAFAAYREKAHHQLSFWWPDHPMKGKGLTRTTGAGGATLEQMRPESGFWSDDVQKLRGRITSPWLEKEKMEAATEQEVAQEIEIDYCGSGWQFYPEVLLRRLLANDIMPPLVEGELVLDCDTAVCRGFSRQERGSLKLWCNLNMAGWPSAEFDYVVGADVAAGSKDAMGAGSSNSCAVALNGQTGEVVAEIAVHGVDPSDFAVMVVGLCHFFRDAFLIWEGNGPGLHFQKTVVDDIGYGNIYYRQHDSSLKRMRNLQPGFWTTPANKHFLFNAHRDALAKGKFRERSKYAIVEYRMYQQTPTGVVHAIAASTPDPTGARENHADRAVARVVAYRGMVDRGLGPMFGEPAQSRIVPANCLAAVRDYHEARTSDVSY